MSYTSSEVAIPDSTLYGELAPAITYLRRHGWVVFREGLNWRVGTKLRDDLGLIQMYYRVRLRQEPNANVAPLRQTGETPSGASIVLDNKKRRYRWSGRYRSKERVPRSGVCSSAGTKNDKGEVNVGD